MGTGGGVYSRCLLYVDYSANHLNSPDKFTFYYLLQYSISAVAMSREAGF